MKIIEVARQQKDLLNEGLAYIAVWQQTQKNGRASWFTEDFFPADSKNEEPVFEDEQKTRLAEIAALDVDAVLLNGYYHGQIGSADEPLNATDISLGIKRHYDMRNALVSSYLADEDEIAEDEYAEVKPTEQPKRRGIMDILVDEINADLPEGEHVERLHSEPTIIDGSGREHHLNGQFAATPTYGETEPTEAELANTAEREYPIEPDFESLPLDEREELGLGKTRREDFQGENGMSADDVPESITIDVPLKGAKHDILESLIRSKQTLITAALGGDAWWNAAEYGTDEIALCDLPIEFTDDTVKFEWLRFGSDGEVVKAWSDFLCTLVKFSRTAKRVTATDKPSDNEKFDFRVFGVRIGLKGDDHTQTRKTLARFLTGNSSFKTSASAERWNAKHGKQAETTDTAEVAE
jgi:hypothetical protein